MAKHEAMGRRLQLSLSHAKITQIELAQKLQISQSYIARMIAGDRGGDRHLQRIAEILGVNESWLRFGDADAAPEWDVIQPQLLAELKEMTKQVSSTKSKPRLSIRELLESMLAEQRAIRQALEKLAKQNTAPVEVSPRRQAVIPRHAAEADLAEVPTTRSDPAP